MPIGGGSQVAIQTYFAEIHALHTFTTQCRTNGRRGRRLPCAYNQFDDLVFCYRFSGHDVWLCDVVMRWAVGICGEARRCRSQDFLHQVQFSFLRNLVVATLFLQQAT